MLGPRGLGFSRPWIEEPVVWQAEDVPVLGLSARPGEAVPVAVVFSLVPGPYTLQAQFGEVTTVDTGCWTWVAPRDPGVYHLLVSDAAMNDVLCIEALVLGSEAARRGTPGTT
jgi:hypothetical protein